MGLVANFNHMAGLSIAELGNSRVILHSIGYCIIVDNPGLDESKNRQYMGTKPVLRHCFSHWGFSYLGSRLYSSKNNIHKPTGNMAFNTVDVSVPSCCY